MKDRSIETVTAHYVGKWYRVASVYSGLQTAASERDVELIRPAILKYTVLDSCYLDVLFREGTVSECTHAYVRLMENTVKNQIF